MSQVEPQQRSFFRKPGRNNTNNKHKSKYKPLENTGLMNMSPLWDRYPLAVQNWVVQRGMVAYQSPPSQYPSDERETAPVLPLAQPAAI